MNDRKQLKKQVEHQVERIKKAKNEQPGVLAQTIFLGTLGLVFVLPIIAGAYLGNWLDNMAQGYSVRWTLSLLFLGVIVGGINAYLLIREK